MRKISVRSSKGLENLLSLALVDRKVREDIKKNPDTLAKRFSLSKDEIQKLKNLEPSRLDHLAWDIDKAMSVAMEDMMDGACM